jgi:hypothetical protein
MNNFLAICFIFCVGIYPAQRDSANKPIAAPLIGVHLGGDMPFGDLAERYGTNLNTGLNVMYKTHRNFLFGIEGSYGFGRNLKQDVLKQLKNSDGFIVDNSGYPADIRTSERVINVVLHGGKLFPFGSANKNAGLVLDAGLGYMQHRVHFVDINQQIAAVYGDIKNGFDHLTNGICASQFVGYMYLGDSRLINFYMGIESYEGFTKSVRKWSYDTGTQDTGSRIDILVGFRVGWILPLYSRTPKNYFYN